MKLKKPVLIAFASMFCHPVYSADFYFGEDKDIALQINSQLSLGASWRMTGQDPTFIGNQNGGTGATMTTDDGNLNFEKHDTYSQIIKGTNEFLLTRDNFGAFVRIKYWYDTELSDGDRPHGNSVNGYIPNTPLSDDGFADNAKFSGITLLDAYLFTQTEIGEMPLDLRLGRQVISWGESTFIQGGINSVNPFDVSAFRRPGATLKEAYLPVGMFYASLGVTESLSVEAFYQFEWEKTQIDGCGTLFSSADFVADGCNAVTISVNDRAALEGGFYAKRRDDVEPDDIGQYGLSLKYYSEALNDTEFGLYYLNIHSRVPMINAVRSATTTIPGVTDVFIPSSLDPTGGSISALNPAYQVEFPEDLQFFGASFATNIKGVAVSGEISYKPDSPVQINGAEILNGVLSESPIFRYTPRVLATEKGGVAKGYDEFDVTQIQLTGIQFIEQFMGASRLSLIGEIGFVHTDGVEDSNQRYGRNTVFGLANFDLGNGINCTNLVAAGAIGSDCQDEGFTTDTAWGYRLNAVWEYPDLVAGISFKPTLSWSHDVDGNSPAPGQQFNEGSRAIGIALEASYLQKYATTLSYKSFSGGSHNTLQDKDFLALSLDISY
ncbi:DUF1302 domain-containing protein [Shewanella woodyi]|uniref:DUF1302 domain-containing protein n=1 Tax=Shewanella woodyi TaxID=60961 RepID=UPI0007E9AFC7|nr:DUF1302 domain-containing protein [Shewanella woodyi]